MIRTRFAPSPTGYLHIGGARTALFCWAYAKKHGGAFILRIEDTDRARSTRESVMAILEGMEWLGLDYHENTPYSQMDRLERYRLVAEQLIKKNQAYYCYASREELDALREQQRARGEKPRYDGRWRPENAKRLGLKTPAGVEPVVRFRNPDDGEVNFADMVKGPITVANNEMDDLVLLRGDGIPTYNFGVVVDDIDMNITHVIRGDDHVNNTPRQINIYKALGATLPKFAHVPMILGPDGERLSKRHGAVSVMQYRDEGYLPEALVNYLARLGWSHGDEEMFSRDQFVEWFDLEHVSQSPARFDPEKLKWMNQQYMKKAKPDRIAKIAAEIDPKFYELKMNSPQLEKLVPLYIYRSHTVSEVSQSSTSVFSAVVPLDLAASHLTAEIRPAMLALRNHLAHLSSWDHVAISSAIKIVVAEFGIKMPEIAMPLRVMVAGSISTPPIDQLLSALTKEMVLERMDRQLQAFPG